MINHYLLQNHCIEVIYFGMVWTSYNWQISLLSIVLMKKIIRKLCNLTYVIYYLLVISIILLMQLCCMNFSSVSSNAPFTAAGIFSTHWASSPCCDFLRISSACHIWDWKRETLFIFHECMRIFDITSAIKLGLYQLISSDLMKLFHGIKIWVEYSWLNFLRNV